MKRQTKNRIISCFLTIVMLIGVLPTLSFAVTTEALNVSKSGTYSIFNSGRTESSGYNAVYNSSNKAPDTHDNGGYDLYGSIDDIPRFRLGMSFTMDIDLSEKASLSIYAWDVDETAKDCGYGYEYDYVYLYDETANTSVNLGTHLSGQNNTWNTTKIEIAPNLFTKGHTYHFELQMTCTGSHTCGYYSITVRTVDLAVVGNGGQASSTGIKSAELAASISSSGVVSASLTADSYDEDMYTLEYKAVCSSNDGQYGGKEYGVTISKTPGVFSTTFSLESDAPRGTYEITVFIKDADKNVVETRTVSVGYNYYAVSYNANGGTQNLPIDTNSYGSGNTVTVKFDYVPSKSGYDFAGWSQDRNAVTPAYTQTGINTFVIGSSDVTLYAVYQKHEDTPDEPGKVWDGAVASGFASGTGTEADPYIIETPEQLAYLASSVNAGTTYEGKYIKLANDIYLNATDGWENWDKTAPKNMWTPIGTSSAKSFKGIFDGDGHVICGIYTDSAKDYQGLFGHVYYGTVKNVGVEKSYVCGANYVGSVCGFNSYGTISNCYNTGTVSGSDCYVGGVCGCNYYGTVTNCYNTGTVSGTGVYDVGGVCGYTGGTVTNCYNTGTVSGNECVGGVYGYSYNGTVANCYNTGTVSGGGDVGGVCGFNGCTVTNCYNTGTVSGNSNVGGVCGYNGYTVTNCYYLIGCAKDGNSVTQYGIGNKTTGSTTADVSGRTTGLTDAEMKKQASFVGFDFDEVWTIKENISYPTLRGMPEQEITEPDEPGNVWDGTAATGFASGTGTEDDPYIIETPEQLAYLASTVNSGTTYNGKYFKLSKDIYLNDTDGWENWDTTAPENMWTPIGTENNYFKGTFDGDGHVICGIFTDSTKDYQGLFGYIYKGTVKNVGIEKSYVCGANNVGGVCGGNYQSGTVTNCYNTGTVSGNSYVGGVCGYNFFDGTVTNCYNTGTVSGNSSVGGVCGGNSETVANCYNTGTVSGNSSVGGVCGYSGGGGTVTNCYNTGTVSGTGNYVGGVCGYKLNGTVANCYNTGTVSGNRYVGGVCGYNNRGTVTNCYNTGTVSGKNYVGGVCGENYDDGTVTNCYNTGTVSGNECVGGVCGYNGGTVTNCYYLIGCAKDGNSVTQYGIGNGTKGSTTADVSGQTTGLTDTEMKKQSSFTGFDFDEVWTIKENISYPTLRGMPEQEITEPDEPGNVWDGTVATGFASGTGTESDPYIIETPEQLAYLASTVNSGTTYEGKYFKLSKDIYLNDTDGWENWDKTAPKNMWTSVGNHEIIPIPYSITSSTQFNNALTEYGVSDLYYEYSSGSYSSILSYNSSYSQYYYLSSFSGTFDGDGHTINGIYVDSTNGYQGLFGYVDGGTVKNVGVEKSYICGNRYVGGVCGYKLNGTVANCYNTGTVNGTRDYVGGVCGYNNLGIVTNCYNTGTVSGTRDYVGGVCGYNYYGTVTNCYNTGAVSGTRDYVGGVCGENLYGTVTDCYNTGTIGGGREVGGVCGFSNGTVKNCYYLIGCAKDGSGVTQYGIGNKTKGSTTADVSGQAKYLTVPEMKKQASFVGFDFDTVWTMEGNPDYLYPELIGMSMADVPPTEPHTHGYTETSRVDPTCTESGKVIYTCSCGDTRTEILPALHHDIISVVEQEATCTQDGIIVDRCQRPGCTYEKTTVIHGEHSFVVSETKEATCTVDGYIKYSCTKCTESYTETIPAGHDYQESGRTEPQVGVPGSITYTCTKCRDHFDVELPALKPVEKNSSVLLIQDTLPWAQDVNTSLLKTLLERGTISSYNIINTTSLASFDLSEYGVVMIANDQTTQMYDRLEQNTAKLENYVKAGGVLIYGACDEGWGGCGSLTAKLPGGVSTGNYYSVYNYIVDALHPIVTGVYTDNRSLSDELLKGNYCSHTYFDKDTLPEGTDVIIRDAKGAPTLVEYKLGDGTVIASGLTWEYFYVRNHYDMLTNYSKYAFDDMITYAVTLSGVAVCDHDYDDGTVYAPTCTEGGYTLYKCALCGHTFRDDIVPALGHEWSAYSHDDTYHWRTCTSEGCTEIEKEVHSGGTATCTDKAVCSECHTEYGNTASHKYVPTVVPATCTTGGYTVYECSGCHDTYTGDETTPLGHNPGEWITDIEPDCLTQGIRHKECTRCHVVLQRESVDALGHSFTDGECERCHIHQYTITVKYQYADGSKVCADAVKSFVEGEKYSFASPLVENYVADKIIVSGTATQSMTVTVTYCEIEPEIILSIRSVALGNVNYNTLFSSLPLPETVTGVTAAGETVSLKVFWNSSDYSMADFGEQTINGTVISGYGYKFGCEAKTTATLTVTRNMITDIPEMSLGKLPLGTDYDGLGLPSTASVTTTSGKTYYLPVEWNTYSYDSAVAGKHTLHGKLTLEDGFAFAEGVENDAAISFELSETMYGTADIVFLIDTTGSMSDEIRNVKNNINAFADMLEKEGVSVRWALLEYRDITCDGLGSTKVIYCGSSEWYIDVNAYKNAISGLTVNGGGDREETVIDALKAATYLESRADAQTFYVVVTDADFKNNNQYGISGMPEMLRELKDGGIVTSVVTKTTYYDTYRSLTDGTGGMLANIDGDFASELFKLSDMIVDTVVYKDITGIEIIRKPDKTDYISGDYFDGTGMTVQATYVSGLTRTVTGYSISPTRPLSVSDDHIDISYRGVTAALPITVSKAEYPVTGVSVSKDKVELVSGETYKVTVTVLPTGATNKNVYWTTDNPNVATVSDGLIRAFEAGTATLTVYTDDGGFSATVTVNVKAADVPAEGIYTDIGTVELYVGEAKKVTATVYPIDATDKTVTWTSSDPTVAAVDGNGNITALAKGRTTVTVTANDGGYTAMVLVTVSEYDVKAPQYTVSKATGHAGETVEISVAIANNPGIISLRNYISYDTEALELIGVESTGLLKGFTDPSADITSPYTLRWADALASANNTANGTVVKLQFRIKDGAAEGQYEVSVTPIEARNYAGQKIVFASASSYIEVVDYVIGDADGDGEISDWDAIILERYLAGWDVDLALEALDIDGDGEISDWDAILLERYLAGWAVVFGER